VVSVGEYDVLVPHTMGTDRAEGLAAAVRERVDADVAVAHSAEKTREVLREVPVVVTYRFPTEWLRDAEGLRLVQTVSAGVDQLDLDAFARRDVGVSNSAGVHAEPIAEHVLCAMLFFERNLHRAVRNQARGAWERVEGGEIRGKTLGIVGVGSIGTRVAEYGAAVGMDVIGTKRDLEDAPEVLDEVLPADEYPTMLRRSDYVVLSCPLTEETEGLLGAAEFAQMGGDAVLINVARGGVCVEDELVEALQERTIRGAALDVFETEPLARNSPLWDLSNVLVTPHAAGSSPRKFDRWGELIVHNIEAIQRGDPAAVRNRVG
jgi:phosphoglycerate dehydrogenase-like enzyme